jgi:acyl-CoA thioester hydrolase
MTPTNPHPPADAAPPALGRFEGRTHHLPIRVYFGETDRAGVLHHAQYFVFAERGRTEMLEAVLAAAGEGRRFADFNFALRRAAARFVQPARMNEVVELTTAVTGVGAAALLLQQRLSRAGETLALLEIELVFIDESLKPVRIPKSLRAALAGLVEPPIP